MAWWTIVYLVAMVLHWTTGSSNTRFTAAVYEHKVISPEGAEGEFSRDDAFFWMSKNLQYFENQAAIASKRGAQIIVFPEYGVTGFNQTRDSMIPFLEDIPDPSENWNPCNEPMRFPHTLVLNNLSCIAKHSQIYIVANMGDIKKCDVHVERKCPYDGRYQFNTNVVFNADGDLIARYHKFHLYDESPLFDPAPKVEYSYFDTPFGRFGTVICFDIMHFYPTQLLIKKYRVTNVLVTSAWNAFYPFVLPTQMYSGLSKRNGVNVIASNARSLEFIMAGSGIFGPGVSVSSDPDFMNDEGVLLIGAIQIDIKVQIMTSLQPIMDDLINIPYRNDTHFGTYDYGMNTSFVVLSGKSGSAVVCGEQVCCVTDYTFEYQDPQEMFIISATVFLMTDRGYLDMQFCAVHRCASRDLHSCGGYVTNAKSSFSYIKIQGYFEKGLLFPFVSTSPYDNMTVDAEMDHYKFDHDNAILKSDKLEHPLLAAVIFNSLYVEERTQAALGTGSVPTLSTLIIGACVLSSRVFYII